MSKYRKDKDDKTKQRSIKWIAIYAYKGKIDNEKDDNGKPILERNLFRYRQGYEK